tara:strand:- start:158 stop:478 length:321 start_codon:yes stop_codon:yes gene_type:complete
MSDLSFKLSWGLVHLGYNVKGNYACSNQATYKDIKETWVHSDAVPSEENILKAYEDWVEADKKIQYQRDRAVAYPSIEDQLDKIYHSGIDEWKKDIKAVKDKYPKP